MIRKKIRTNGEPIIIDLEGPDGNAYALLGMAKTWAKQLNLDWRVIEAQATASDYENLLTVLDNYFGSFVIFEK